MRTRHWIYSAVAAMVVLASLIYAIQAVWPILFPSMIAVAPLVPDCDLRQGGGCTAVLPDGGKVQLAIEPRDIPVLKPLTLIVRTQGVHLTRVEVDFAGVDMNMGYNRVELSQDSEGLWQGQATLPVCIRKRMRWEAKVLLQTEVGLLAAPFQFDTFSPASGTEAG